MTRARQPVAGSTSGSGAAHRWVPLLAAVPSRAALRNPEPVDTALAPPTPSPPPQDALAVLLVYRKRQGVRYISVLCQQAGRHPTQRSSLGSEVSHQTHSLAGPLLSSSSSSRSSCRKLCHHRAGSAPPPLSNRAPRRQCAWRRRWGCAGGARRRAACRGWGSCCARVKKSCGETMIIISMIINSWLQLQPSAGACSNAGWGTMAVPQLLPFRRHPSMQ